jgi:putative tricarboxylic transport membrane protein
MIGSYAAASSYFDVWVMLISGLVGFFMLRNGFGPAPLIMGLILGKIVEETFSQAMIIHDNNFFAMLERPIVAFFFVRTAISLLGPVFSEARRRQKNRRLVATQYGE